ncbi:MAG: type II secretion system F family protein, partial [Rhodospirillales bacterium]|nr:type II secretion system F family protein [Rhodospirillales bacterium]
MSLPVIVIFLGVLVSVGVAAVALGGTSPRALVRKRARALNRPQQNKPGVAAGARQATTSVKRAEARSVPSVEALTRRIMPRQAALRDRLARTGYAIAPGSYATICLGVAAFMSLAIYMAVGLLPLAVLLGLVAGAGLPHLVVGILGARRKASFVNLLPEAIDLMVRGLKSGLPVTESMAAVGREMIAPLGPEFAHITDCVRFGQPLQGALWDTARRMDAPEFNFFVISLSIQRETGGNLGETLGNLSDIIRRRRQMRLKIRSMSS